MRQHRSRSCKGEAGGRLVELIRTHMPPFSPFFFRFLSLLVQNPHHRRRVEFDAYARVGGGDGRAAAGAGEAAAPAAAAPAGGGLA
eukprot:COSAG06_NODE_16559_length_994_cov_1.042458_1_plen_85_part_10